MELIANALQTVDLNDNILFTDEVIGGCQSILHRGGSGQVTLRGLTNQCRARFRVFFGGNIAVPAGGTAGPISLAIALNGEPVQATEMIQTPTVTAAFANVASSIFIDVPRGCCVTLSVKNVSSSGSIVDVQNANLIVERVA